MGVQINGDTGNVIATKGTFSGDVGIGGTLTYEDVTNIDAVGLITARSGIEIGARPGVAASISVDGNMIISGISTFGGDVQVPDKIIHKGDTNTSIRFPANDTVSFQTGGDEAFRINSGQKILVGTTAQRDVGSSAGQSVLAIEGISQNRSSISLINNQASGTPPTIRFGKTRGTSVGAVDSVTDGDSLGQIRFAGSDGTDLENTTGMIVGKVNGTVSSNTIPTDIVFETSATDSNARTEKVRIQSNGRVGIGTATANAKLHILHSESSDEPGILLEDGSVSSGAPYLEIIGKRSDNNSHQSFSGQVYLSRNRTAQKVGSGVKLGTILFGGNHTDGSKSNILYAASIAGVSGDSFDSATDMPTDIAFYTGSTGRSPGANNVSSGSERLRITSDGKFGFGTDSPSTTIHILAGGGNGVIEMQRSSTNTTGNVGAINFTASDGHSVASVGAYGDGDNESAYINFKTTTAASANSPFTSTTERMRIHGNGDVCVGTTSSSGKFRIRSAGNGSGANALDVENSDNDELFRVRNDGAIYLGVDTGSPYNFTGGSANLNIQSSGRVRRVSSSIRYKKDIQDATWGLADVLKLRPITYKSNGTGENEDDHTYGGFTAEDIHDIGLTDFVEYNENNEPDALHYPNMVALMAKAIQELKAEVDALKSN